MTLTYLAVCLAAHLYTPETARAADSEPEKTSKKADDKSRLKPSKHKDVPSEAESTSSDQNKPNLQDELPDASTSPLSSPIDKRPNPPDEGLPSEDEEPASQSVSPEPKTSTEIPADPQSYYDHAAPPGVPPGNYQLQAPYTPPAYGASNGNLLQGWAGINTQSGQPTAPQGYRNTPFAPGYGPPPQQNGFPPQSPFELGSPPPAQTNNPPAGFAGL
ncbi:MAG: hypothetical protein K2Z81_11445, partial [Cyanobacteria bacterium]|nr:hypothetical protein [Cyanobacteriota bacterium]